MRELIDRHIGELGPAYAWLHRVDSAARPDAAALLDRLLSERVPLPENLPTDNAISSLRAAVDAAYPDRDCFQFIVKHFPAWLAAVHPSSRAAFLAALPTLAPAATALGEKGMTLTIQAVNRDPRLLPAIACFAQTTPAIIKSVAQLAATQPVAALQRLAAQFPLRVIEESREAEKLVADLSAAPDSLSLLLTVAAQNVSSAAALVRALKGKQLPPAYLQAFETIVQAVGTRAIRWCLDTLPSATDPAQAAASLEETAQNYGALAAEALMEGKTPAAKQWLAALR